MSLTGGPLDSGDLIGLAGRGGPRRSKSRVPPGEALRSSLIAFSSTVVVFGVIVVAVSPNTVTFEDLSRRAGVTRDSLSNFLAGFTRLKSPAR